MQTNKINKKLILLITFIYGFYGYISDVLPEYLIFIKTLVSIFDIVLIFYGLGFINKKYNNYKFFIFFRFFTIILIIISSFTYLINFEKLSFLHHLNGLREVFLLIAFFYILQNELEKDYTGLIIWFKKIILILMLLQIPIAINQFILYGTIDLDRIGGSFGNGGSGVLSQILFLNLFLIYIIDKNLLKKNYNFLYLFLLFPTFINETKISLIFLLIYFLCVLLLENKATGFIYLIIFLVLITIFINVYNIVTNFKDFWTMLSVNFLEDYLFSQNIYQSDISRITRLELSYQLIISKDLFTYLLGIGYGINKGGTVISNISSVESIKYLIKGSRILLQIQLLKGGILLVIVYFLINFYYLISQPLKIIKKNFYVFLYFSLLFFIGWFYNDAFGSNQFFMFNSALIILILSQFNIKDNEILIFCKL